MHATLALLTSERSRQLIELGALLGLLSGLALAARELSFFRRFGLIVAGLLLAVGFALIIWSVHFGKGF
jgi:hypothetical protein